MDYCPKEFSLFWLNQQLGNDERFVQESLAILRRDALNRPEHARGTYTPATSAAGLINEWLSNCKLYGYSRGHRIEDFLALTVIPFGDDIELGIQNLDAMITIKRDELIALMTEEGIDRLPDCLRLADTAANDGFAQKRMPPNLSIWGAKDLWSITEFALLLCGAEPGGRGRTARLSNTALDTTMRAIKLAVAAESLTVAHVEQDPTDWSTFSAPATVRYFKPADAIAWANRRRAEFPLFPSFEVSAMGFGNAPNDETVSGVAEHQIIGGPANWPEPSKPLVVTPMAGEPNVRHVATERQLLDAFGCKPTLFENGRKYPWFLEARTAGTGRANGTSPMYDPVAFASKLPHTTYGNGITEKAAYKALKHYFPELYDVIEHFIPDEMK